MFLNSTHHYDMSHPSGVGTSEYDWFIFNDKYIERIAPNEYATLKETLEKHQVDLSNPDIAWAYYHENFNIVFDNDDYEETPEALEVKTAWQALESRLITLGIFVKLIEITPYIASQTGLENRVYFATEMFRVYKETPKYASITDHASLVWRDGIEESSYSAEKLATIRYTDYDMIVLDLTAFDLEGTTDDEKAQDFTRKYGFTLVKRTLNEMEALTFGLSVEDIDALPQEDFTAGDIVYTIPFDEAYELQDFPKSLLNNATKDLISVRRHLTA